MALSNDTKSKWYKALFEEDCVAVMKLLDADPRLLKEGWETDASRQVEGRKRNSGEMTKSAWKGRTALHVGAGRGCVQLIMQVLRLCNFEDFDVVDQTYQQSSRLLEDFSFRNFVSHDEFQCGVCRKWLWGSNRWNSTVKPYYNLCPDCYQKQRGNEKDFIKIECGWRKPPVVGTISPTSRSDGKATKGKPGQSHDSSTDDRIEQGDPHSGREHAQATEKSESVSLGPPGRKFQKAVATIVRKNRLDKSDQQASDGSVSDQDVRDLLTAQDGERGLDAEAIAALNGNPVVKFLLLHAGSRFAKLLNASTDDRASLRKTIIESTKTSRLRFYMSHRDFNFLPPEEYLFHFMVAVGWAIDSHLWRNVRSSRASSGDELWKFLLQYQDGQGRPPFHVAMEESNENDFVKVIKTLSSTTDGDDSSMTETGNEREVVVYAMTTCDAVGRTPIQRAAARGLHNTVKLLLNYAVRYKEVAATCYAYWRFDSSSEGLISSSWVLENLKHDRVSKANGFPLSFQLPHTPLQAAMIHGNFDCAKLLIEKWYELKEKWPELKWGDMAFRSIDEKLIDSFRKDKITLRTHETDWGQKYRAWIEWDIVEFACLVGAPDWFLRFLLDKFPKYDLTKTQPSNPDDLYDENRTDAVTLKHLWHPLHLLASSGRYDMLKYFIDDRKCSPFLEDYDGNSALHHALKVTKFQLETHLMDYVDGDHASLAKDKASLTGKGHDNRSIAERQRCINLLVQAGCDVLKANKRKQLPHPVGDLNDATFLSWWNRKQEEEFKTAQNNLNFATNAIAVTATLVATASYVGPLQPPMGYDANQIQYENVWVSMFIVCDTLSFYFAIFAITLSLISALPMPQQGMMEELQRTRGMVILAVGVLLPSVFFVFVAFACSSISVMSANITSEIGGILTIVSTLVGMVLCLLGFALFTVRLLAFVYPGKGKIRSVYEFTNHITNFSR